MATPTRRDAARNRELLLSAARRLFADQGPDAPLEAIAEAAGVSRTTLHRHFTDRAELASAVLEENVVAIERRAGELADQDDGAVRLFHHMIDVQQGTPWLARVVDEHGDSAVGQLGRRTAAALEPLVARARAAGIAHPDVTTEHLLLTLPMIMASTAVQHRQAARTEGDDDRLQVTRAIVHRGLFTTAAPQETPADR